MNSSTNVSNAQILQYLKASLKWKNYRVIHSIQILDSNFAIAWKLQDEIYSNKWEQTFTYIKRFLRLPSIQTEVGIDVLNFVDIINEITVSLETLNQQLTTNNRWYINDIFIFQKIGSF